ncbi:MAG TPA: glycerate kinase, partial [Mycobacteriales bacterium]|nr:glycerate kinase [Mycobacteriales bacterium]
MRIVIAPDCFTGTLSAGQAAEAIAAGWRAAARTAAGEPPDLDLVPLSDGGPGFAAVLGQAFGVRLREVRVRGPLGQPVTARWLLANGTAYVESAEAAGLHLVPPAVRDPLAASSFGVGQLLRAALEAGPERVVVGLGGSATTDGGAGLLDALGAPGWPAGVPLVAATDVDSPLLGPDGAARTFGPQKGADARQVAVLEERLSELAGRIGPRYASVAGAGAAGGLGFALLTLGATRVPGAALVVEATRLADRLAGSALVVTGEGSYDAQSLRGKVVTAVARAALDAGVPCLVLAGQVQIGRRHAAAT